MLPGLVYANSEYRAAPSSAVQRVEALEGARELVEYALTLEEDIPVFISLAKARRIAACGGGDAALLRRLASKHIGSRSPKVRKHALLLQIALDGAEEAARRGYVGGYARDSEREIRAVALSYVSDPVELIEGMSADTEEETVERICAVVGGGSYPNHADKNKNARIFLTLLSLINGEKARTKAILRAICGVRLETEAVAKAIFCDGTRAALFKRYKVDKPGRVNTSINSMLMDSDVDVRYAYMRALYRLSKANELVVGDAVCVLGSLLDDESCTVRTASAQMLARIARRRDVDEEVRERARSEVQRRMLAGVQKKRARGRGGNKPRARYRVSCCGAGGGESVFIKVSVRTANVGAGSTHLHVQSAAHRGMLRYECPAASFAVRFVGCAQDTLVLWLRSGLRDITRKKRVSLASAAATASCAQPAS